MTAVDPRTAGQFLESVRTRQPVVVVLGDVLLDRRFEGTSERLCREGPVPVLDVQRVQDAPGGAANTAMNLAALGARVRLVGVAGDDEPGSALVQCLAAAGIEDRWLVRRPGAATAVKARMVADGQLLLRVDTCRTASDDEAADVARAASAALEGADAVVLCDYRLGALAALDRDDLRDAAHTLIVDAHSAADWAGLHADVATPNAAEAAALLGAAPPHGDRGRWAAEHAHEIARATGASHTVVTLDRDGTVVLGPDGARHRTLAHPAPEQNAVGAGDTFTAGLALALAAGLGIDDAADIAQAAADAVVESPGTSTCSAEQLAERLRGDLGDAQRAAGAAGEGLSGAADAARAHGVRKTGVGRWEEVLAVAEEARGRGERIVLTNGVFDGLHRGHTAFLEEAASLGGLLIVAVNSDASAERLRGQAPAVGEDDRAAVVAALAAVDCAAVFDSETAVDLIHSLRPDVYVKGGDYLPGMLAESDAVEEVRGRLETLRYVDRPAPAPRTGVWARTRA
ncbi:PfkB family carbohydrate kinase [Sinomonas halotolerans]|uniref:PfkB family carbohydrate kinase n=1 Tax=Sinomonas halotolerans TaxID=1644133 RepID=A0ABU9X244_9MICC